MPFARSCHCVPLQFTLSSKVNHEDAVSASSLLVLEGNGYEERGGILAIREQLKYTTPVSVRFRAVPCCLDSETLVLPHRLESLPTHNLHKENYQVLRMEC
jgi:hypothetical protein